MTLCLNFKEVCETTIEVEEWMVVGFNVAEFVKNNEREKTFPADMSTTSVLWVIRTGGTLPRVEGRPAEKGIAKKVVVGDTVVLSELTKLFNWKFGLGTGQRR